jgi:hypothetical protein
MNNRVALLVSVAALALPVTVNSASAVTSIALGLSIDGGAIVPQAIVCAGTTCSFAVAGFNGFNITAGTQGIPPLALPDILQSNSTQVTADASGVGHVLRVFVTELGITVPTGSNLFQATLTTNALSSGATTQLSASYDSNNGLFGMPASQGGTCATCIGLGQHLFNAIGTSIEAPVGIAITTPYSITTEFAFFATAIGQGANSTIDVTVPGPIAGAGLPGLIAACIGLIGLARRRRQKTA